MRINLKFVVLCLPLSAALLRCTAQDLPADNSAASTQKKWDFSLIVSG